MGLNHPDDLEAWRKWQRSQQHLSRRVRAAIPSSKQPTATLWATGRQTPDVVSVVDAVTPTSSASLLAPLAALEEAVVGVIAPGSVDLRGRGFTAHISGRAQEVFASLPDRTIFLSLGPALALGAEADQRSATTSARHVTVQHGLLTPHAPPLARGTHLLAWSEADGAFWRSGRKDVTVDVVGSTLLWQAATDAPAFTRDDARAVFLGQLHGAELPRQAMASVAEAFCTSHGAIYRPHPAETDRLSERFHARLERLGVRVDRSRHPLVQLRKPLVSAFSTGVYEGAARGIPTWVHFSSPPIWLEEFWGRYGLHTWGMSPTPAPPTPLRDPSLAIAQVVREMMEA